MNKQLKPCPVCGGEAILQSYKHGVFKPKTRYEVKCKECFFTTGWYYADKDQMIELWNNIAEKAPDKINKVQDFLTEISAICKKYGMSISHEDFHGSFIIEDYNEYNIKWLNDASIEIKGSDK